MANYDIAPEVEPALRNFRLPEKLGFGLVNAPVMYSVEWANGAWGRGQLLPHGPISILPGARAFHYAEVVFEGLKAYRVGRPGANLFRPLENCRRLARSAERLAMPVVPEALFLEAIDAVAGALTAFVPGKSGHALYLRPFLFGTESGYLVSYNSEYLRQRNWVQICLMGECTREKVVSLLNALNRVCFRRKPGKAMAESPPSAAPSATHY